MLKWPEVQEHPPHDSSQPAPPNHCNTANLGFTVFAYWFGLFPKTEIHSQKLSRTVQRNPVNSLATADIPPKGAQPCFRTELLSWTNSQRHQNDKDPSCLDHQCRGQPSVSIAGSDLHRSAQFSMQPVFFIRRRLLEKHDSCSFLTRL